MYKSRIIAMLFIVFICIPIGAVPIQVRAKSDISDFSRLAGNSIPVINAVTNCTIGKILGLAQKAGEQAQYDAINGVLSASISDPNIFDKLDQINQEAVHAKNKAMCTVPIARAAAQTILKIMTEETVNWINSGMDGKPMYAQDPAAPFLNLQNQAINDFKNVLQSDPNSFPFGKDSLSNAMQQYNSSFANQNSLTLSTYLSEVNSSLTMKDFSSDLKNGGWAAFNASLQPRNNVVGFNFEVNDQFVKILNDNQYTKAHALADQLNWGRGFMSQMKCVSPSGADPSSPLCKKTIIVTPGSTIGAALDKSLGGPQDALNLGNDLDASISSIMNALFSKLLQTGLSSVTDDSQSSNPNALVVQTITGNATPGSLCGVQSSTDWYKQYPNFNFTGGGLIALSKREILLANILKDQNSVLKKTITSIYALDYCVPGPRPFDVKSTSGQAYGAILQNIPTGNTRIINAQFLNDKIGLPVFPNHKVGSILNVTKIVKAVTDRYFTAVNFLYHDRGPDGAKPIVEDLIPEAADSVKYYAKLGYYQQTIADNEAKLNLINATVGQLNNMQAKLSNLQTEDSANGKDLKTDYRFINLQNAFNVMIPDLDVSPYSTSQ
ncbi:MAG: hypothetical protein WCO65_03025 [bacterium]